MTTSPEEIVLIGLDSTIGQALKLCHRLNASSMKWIISFEATPEEIPVAAVILCRGQEECKRILEAVGSIEVELGDSSSYRDWDEEELTG